LTCSVTLALLPKDRHAAAVMAPDVVPEMAIDGEGTGRETAMTPPAAADVVFSRAQPRTFPSASA
jgi:hypothetical protein